MSLLARPVAAGGSSCAVFGGLLAPIGPLPQPAIARVTGADVSNTTTATRHQVACGPAENPDFLAALTEAIQAARPTRAVVTTTTTAGPLSADNNKSTRVEAVKS